MRNTWVAVLFLMAGALAARDAAWQPFEYLEGEWVGEGGGQPGRASGGSLFRFDLDGRVLVRTNRADYPATKDRPAFSHSDLMIVYREPADGPFRAIYFDSEGHVIRYAVNAAADSLQFVSESAPGPRYRMTYRRTGADALSFRFEVAPPGQDFRTYLEAKLRKKR